MRGIVTTYSIKYEAKQSSICIIYNYSFSSVGYTMSIANYLDTSRFPIWHFRIILLHYFAGLISRLTGSELQGHARTSMHASGLHDYRRVTGTYVAML